jgi:hypothetical protein
MKRIDAATAWSLGLWFVFALVPALGQTFGWRSLVGHQGLAAWVQAIGSVVAIAAAVQIASNQHREALALRSAETAEAVWLRRALIEQCVCALEQARASLVPSTDPVYLKVRDKTAWTDALRRLKEFSAALNGIEFRELRHPNELIMLTDAKGALSIAIETMQRVDGYFSRGVWSDVADSRELLQLQLDKYGRYIAVNWSTEPSEMARESHATSATT